MNNVIRITRRNPVTGFQETIYHNGNRAPKGWRVFTPDYPGQLRPVVQHPC